MARYFDCLSVFLFFLIYICELFSGNIVLLNFPIFFPNILGLFFLIFFCKYLILLDCIFADIFLKLVYYLSNIPGGFFHDLFFFLLM